MSSRVQSSAARFSEMVAHLRAEHQTHLAAAQEIETTFSSMGLKHLLGAPRRGGVRAGALRPKSGKEIVLEALRPGPKTSAELTAMWSATGRGGLVHVALASLIKQGLVVRKAAGRGSIYELRRAKSRSKS